MDMMSRPILTGKEEKKSWWNWSRWSWEKERTKSISRGNLKFAIEMNNVGDSWLLGRFVFISNVQHNLMFGINRQYGDCVKDSCCGERGVRFKATLHNKIWYYYINIHRWTHFWNNNKIVIFSCRVARNYFSTRTHKRQFQHFIKLSLFLKKKKEHFVKLP